MNNNNNNNDFLTISGERMTLSQLNENVDTLTNNIFSMMNTEQTLPLSNFSNINNTTNIFQNLFHNQFLYLYYFKFEKYYLLNHYPSIY